MNTQDNILHPSYMLDSSYLNSSIKTNGTNCVPKCNPAEGLITGFSTFGLKMYQCVITAQLKICLF